MEKLADGDQAENGISFKNRKKELFDWENEEYNDEE